MLFQLLFLIGDLHFRHFGKSEVVLAYIQHAEVVYLGHCKTLRGAYCCAEPTEATLAHVYIEFGRIDPARCSVGCLADLFNGLDRLDRNTVYRANLGALVAYDTIVYLIVQPVTPVIRHGLHLVWILYRVYAFGMQEVVFAGYGDGFTAGAGFYQVPQGKPQPASQRAYRCCQVGPICCIALHISATKIARKKMPESI